MSRHTGPVLDMVLFIVLIGALMYGSQQHGR